jgi:hypothetical protein
MLNIDKIVKVYNGRIGCMCGCNGKYSYTAHGAVENSPGYDVTDSVNERSVRIIAKKILANPNVKFEDNYAYVEDRARNKMQMVVFKEPQEVFSPFDTVNS